MIEWLTEPGAFSTAVCPFYIVDHPAGTAVVDTGFSHEMLDDPADYGPYGVAFMEVFLPAIEYSPDIHPRAHPEDAGYTSEDIDYLVLHTCTQATRVTSTPSPIPRSSSSRTHSGMPIGRFTGMTVGGSNKHEQIAQIIRERQNNEKTR